jgi:hypothetical protein
MIQRQRRKFITNIALGSSAFFMAGCNRSAGDLKSGTGKKAKITKRPIIGHGDFQYKVDKMWGNQDPSSYPVDHCHEMVMDSKGRLILCTTHTKNNILIYDRGGKILESWGTSFPGAHGLTIMDEGGEEFLYLTDTIKNQVYKLNMKGDILLTLDFPQQAGVYVKKEEFIPTETVIKDDGTIVVADGYGKDFVISYDQKGNYLGHFGGKGDNEDQLQNAHGICIDTREGKEPCFLVTSRAKQEFKRFSLDGKHKETIKLPGCSICRPVIKGENLYFAVIVTKDWWSYDGMVAILDKNNKVISLPGGSDPLYENGEMSMPIYDGTTFMNPHDVCIDNDENIYVPQWYSGRTYPVKLERT